MSRRRADAAVDQVFALAASDKAGGSTTTSPGLVTRAGLSDFRFFRLLFRNSGLPESDDTIPDSSVSERAFSDVAVSSDATAGDGGVCEHFLCIDVCVVRH